MRTFDDQGNLVPEKEKERRAFYKLPMPNQAGIMTNDESFQRWLCGMNSAEDCAAAIRAHCRVDSRAAIQPSTEAGDRWRELLRSYEGVR